MWFRTGYKYTNVAESQIILTLTVCFTASGSQKAYPGKPEGRRGNERSKIFCLFKWLALFFNHSESKLHAIFLFHIPVSRSQSSRCVWFFSLSLHRQCSKCVCVHKKTHIHTSTFWAERRQSYDSTFQQQHTIQLLWPYICICVCVDVMQEHVWNKGGTRRWKQKKERREKKTK